MISIIIPVKNQFKIVKMCLDSVERDCINYEVILIDDGSTEQNTIDMLNEYSVKNNWKLIRNEKSLGHSKACELGINNSSEQNICLLNSDTIVTNNCMKILSDFLDKNEDIGVCGPMTSSASGKQLIKDAFNNRFAWNIEQIEEYAFGIEKQEGFEDIGLVNGFAFCIKRNVINELKDRWGYLFTPELNAYGNEKELLLRIRDLKYRTVYLKNCYVHHFGKMSYSQEQGINIGKCQSDSDKFILKKHGRLE